MLKFDKLAADRKTTEYVIKSNCDASEMTFLWMLSEFTDNAPLDKLLSVITVMEKRLNEITDERIAASQK